MFLIISKDLYNPKIGNLELKKYFEVFCIYINIYHVEYDQVQILLSFSAFEKKHCKGLHGDFFLLLRNYLGVGIT